MSPTLFGHLKNKIKTIDKLSVFHLCLKLQFKHFGLPTLLSVYLKNPNGFGDEFIYLAKNARQRAPEINVSHKYRLLAAPVMGATCHGCWER